MSAMILAFRGVEVRRAEDRVNLTDLWRAAGSDPSKRPADWARKEGASFIRFVAGFLNMPVGHIYETSAGKGGATWAHIDIGIAYAEYLSDEIHHWCVGAIKQQLAQREAPLSSDIKSALVEITATMRQTALQTERFLTGVNALSQSVGDLRGAVVGVAHEVSVVKSEVGAMKDDISALKDATNSQRLDFHDRVKRRYRAVVFHCFGGLCPCCGVAKIMESIKGQVYGVYDHWAGHRRTNYDEGWLVCADCNVKLGPAGADLPQRRAYHWRFAVFHERLKDHENRQLALIPGGKDDRDGAA